VHHGRGTEKDHIRPSSNKHSFPVQYMEINRRKKLAAEGFRQGRADAGLRKYFPTAKSRKFISNLVLLME
jgi:hypothetical protein